MNRPIDHIVYCVPDLEKAIEELNSILGVRPKIGGRHLSQGTRNALLNLGNWCYLELLAVDEENILIDRPRWMGIDLITSPRVTRWALKSDDIKKDAENLRKHNPELARVIRGKRQTDDDKELEWKMTMPLADPVVDLIPFFTDWSVSDVHPTDGLPQKCQLKAMEFTHTNPLEVSIFLQEYQENIDIRKGNNNEIVIYIDSPKGIVKL